MSAFMAFATAADSTGDGMKDFENEMARVGDSLSDLFNSIDGISNSYSSFSNGIFEMSLNFKDLEAYNNTSKIAKDNPGQSGMVNPGVMSYSKNVLTFTADMSALDSLRTSDNSESAPMLAMITLSQHFRFVKEIKSIDNPLATLDQDRKGFTMTYKLSEALKEDFNPGFKVKF